MVRFLVYAALVASITGALSGCGDNGSNGMMQPAMTSFVGTTGAFVAWADGSSGRFAAAPIGSYAGKRQLIRGTIDEVTGTDLGQLAGAEIYKFSDGHVYALDLTSSSTPAARQVSSESSATIDDTCSLNGTQVAGASYDYLGVNFAADLANAANSHYFYRLPGPDGVCNTADDVIQMVTTATPSASAPITVPAMPIAAPHNALGAINGFVAKSGATLVLYDANFANPVILGAFPSPIGVAIALPVGTVQGFPTGDLYVVDGRIVYVNYASPAVSASLFTIPNWTPTSPHTIFAASPTTMYFAVNLPASGSTPASTNLYAMPADGSAAPNLVVTQPGFVAEMQFPVQSSNLIFSTVSNGTYSVSALPQGAATPITLVASAQNSGSFTATATSVYYTTWTQTTNASTLTQTRTSTQSGIVGVNGSVIQVPVANSTFASGGEYFPWPLVNGSTTTQTALQTVFQVQNLSPVTVFGPTTGYTYTIDGISGGTVIAIDTATNQAVATVGTVPAGTATFLTALFRAGDHSGFIEASTIASTQDPATRDLYLVNSHSANTLEVVTRNL